MDDGERRIQRALELDPNEPEAHRIMGVIRMYRGDFDTARTHVEKAMELSPSDAYIRGRASAFYIYLGQPERALRLLDEAAELDPFLPVWCAEERAAALYNLLRFREAIQASLRLPFQTRRSRLFRAAAHAALGEMDEASKVVAEAVASAPGLTSMFVEEQEHYRDPSVTAALVDRLRQAGLPGAAHTDL